MLKRNFILLAFVAWFALLQTMAPFVHGHIGDDAGSSTSALHLHELESASLSNLSHQANLSAHNGYVVSLDEVILNKHQTLASPSTAEGSAQVTFIFAVMLLLTALPIFVARHVPTKTVKHPHPRTLPHLSRAPPHF